jgi:hypothetical protein
MSDLPEYRRQLALLEHPGLKKAAPRSREELSKEHASLFFGAGAEASKQATENESQRGVAKEWLERDERMLRDYVTGARDVPFFMVFKLPRAGLLAVIRCLIEYAQTLESEPPPPLTGTDNR